MSARSWLNEAVEIERLWDSGLALGLTDDEVALLYADSVRRARRANRALLPCMKWNVERVARTGEHPPKPELFYERAGLLNAHAARLVRQVWLHWTAFIGRGFDRIQRRGQA